MKIILDANILISYLLARSDVGTIVQVVETCFERDITLLFPQELATEIVAVWQRKPYLRERIHALQMADFFERLLTVAEIPDSLPTFSRVAPDAHDDYLIAYGIQYGVDYLVTGDSGLLVLHSVNSLKIVDPVDFLMVLREADASVDPCSPNIGSIRN